MSQAMNQKAAPKKKKTKTRLPVMEEPEELTGAEKMFEMVRPHLSTIGLVLVAGLLGFIAVAFMVRSRFDQNALQWRELTNSSAIALRTGDISGLKAVADTYPDSKAGLWALQMAGDQQLRMGIEQLSFDREAGIQLIKKAKDCFKSIVDAPQTNKTTMLDRRSHFSLAYASESLGQLDEAKTIYEKLVAEAPDSAFADPARRGIERASNDQYGALYTKFANFEEEVIGDAPGPAIPDRPVIDFMDPLPPGEKPPTTSGDFVPSTESPAVEKPAVEGKAEGDKSDAAAPEKTENADAVPEQTKDENKEEKQDDEDK